MLFKVVRSSSICRLGHFHDDAALRHNPGKRAKPFWETKEGRNRGNPLHPFSPARSLPAIRQFNIDLSKHTALVKNWPLALEISPQKRKSKHVSSCCLH